MTLEVSTVAKVKLRNCTILKIPLKSTQDWNKTKRINWYHLFINTILKKKYCVLVEIQQSTLIGFIWKFIYYVFWPGLLEWNRKEN